MCGVLPGVLAGVVPGDGLGRLPESMVLAEPLVEADRLAEQRRQLDKKAGMLGDRVPNSTITAF